MLMSSGIRSLRQIAPLRGAQKQVLAAVGNTATSTVGGDRVALSERTYVSNDIPDKHAENTHTKEYGRVISVIQDLRNKSELDYVAHVSPENIRYMSNALASAAIDIGHSVRPKATLTKQHKRLIAACLRSQLKCEDAIRASFIKTWYERGKLMD